MGHLENPLAATRADQRTRGRKLWWGNLLYTVILVGSSFLLAYFPVYTPGLAMYLALRVIGYTGLAVSLCWGRFLVQQWDEVTSEEQRIID